MKKGAEDALELTPKNRLNRMRKVVHMPDLENMPEVLKGLLEPGDTVLIKASHSMGFEKILEMI
jgi:UDP-N-acetylmuramoyl-tripeptide--D-alanyl-D-alanine ligase